MHEFELDKDQLENLQKWTGVVGIILIISGVINTITGVFFFFVGAIPGIISIILGLKLRGVKKHIKDYLYTQSDYPLNLLFTDLTSYFKIQGIFTIVMIVAVFLLGILGAFAGLAMY